MKIFRFFFVVLIVCSLLTVSFAQEQKPPNKEQTELETKGFELLTEVTGEAASLKVAENRIFIYSIASRLFWGKDRKLARQFAQNAANELIEIQNSPKVRNQFGQEGANYWFYILNNLRGQFLTQLQQKDAPFALEILYATRSSELNNLVQIYQQIIAQTGKNPDLSNYKQEERDKLQKAITEIHLEQAIKKEIAKNDPQKLAENIRETFAKELSSYQFLSDLDFLNEKDHELAQRVLSEIMVKLADADFSNHSKSYVAYLFYTRFLADQNKPKNKDSAAKNKPLEFDEKGIKAIANKEFDYLLKKNLTDYNFNFVERVLYLKKILPARFPEIKSKYEEAKGSNREWIDSLETTEKLGENPTLNQIIENSSKLETYSKTDYYKKSIRKLFETESQEKIAQLLDQIPDEKDREAALDYLNIVSAEKKSKLENAAEAKQAVLQIKSSQEKVAKFINLAISYHEKKTDESRKIAEDLMGEAGKLVKEKPATYTEFTALLPVIAGYASVKPQKSFDLILPIIEQSNELINAYILLTNYNDNGYPYVSDNEIIFGAQDGYHSFNGRYREIARKLATSDFEKSKNLVKSFQRADVRIMAKLILIESVLQK